MADVLYRYRTASWLLATLLAVSCSSTVVVQDNAPFAVPPADTNAAFAPEPAASETTVPELVELEPAAPEATTVPPASEPTSEPTVAPVVPTAEPVEPTPTQAVEPAESEPAESEPAVGTTIDTGLALPISQELPAGKLTAEQLDQVMPSMLGPVDDLAATMNQIVPFPELYSSADASITYFATRIFNDGWAEDRSSQRRTWVHYETRATPIELHTAYLAQLSGFGTVTESVLDPEIFKVVSVLAVSDDGATEWVVEITKSWHTDGLYQVRLGYYLTMDVAADLERLSNWHQERMPWMPDAEIETVTFGAITERSFPKTTTFDISWAPSGTEAETAAELNAALDGAGWAYEKRSDSIWDIVDPVVAAYTASDYGSSYSERHPHPDQ